jgi:hypothetical protein
VKNELRNIPVQGFKNCFMPWEHCKELEGDYFAKF